MEIVNKKGGAFCGVLAESVVVVMKTVFRSLTRDLGVDGNVWWVHSLGVSSHIQKGLSYISLWRLSSLSSSKVLLLHLPITDVQGWLINLTVWLFVKKSCEKKKKKQEIGGTKCSRISLFLFFLFHFSVFSTVLLIFSFA
jgi:hypothetical protein